MKIAKLLLYFLKTLLCVWGLVLGIEHPAPSPTLQPYACCAHIPSLDVHTEESVLMTSESALLLQGNGLLCG